MCKGRKAACMRVVWVTGASSGLGLHTAMALKRAGWQVVAGARSFAGHEGEAEPGYRLPLDVTSEQSILSFRDRALALFGTPDALVNCAGILVLGAMEDVTLPEIRSVLETNLVGQIAMVQAVLPFMREKKSGRIVNFSSINGLLGIPYQGVYTASKHAVEGYSESLALEVKPFGISVCLVEPGDHKSGAQAYRKHALRAAQSAYKPMYAQATAVIARDERNGSDPDRLGGKVARALGKRRMPCRLCVAKFDQHLAVWLHKLLPYALFSRIIGGYYVKRRGGNQH